MPRVARRVRQQAQQHVEAAAVDKDRAQVVVAGDEPRERRGHALARGPVAAAHREQHAGEHGRPRGLVLEALERLLHAVLGRLHEQLAVEEGLHRALADERGDVVVRVREAVEGEGGVVLEVAVAGGEEGEEGLEAACVEKFF